MRYEVVLFDVGETLIGPRVSYGQVYSDVLGKLGLRVGATDLESGMREAWEEIDREIPPGADRYGWHPGGEEEYWLRFARLAIGRACGSPLPQGLAEKALPRLRRAFLEDGAWKVYDDVHPALAALRNLGARLGVVSNWDSRLPAILDRLGLRGYFETVTVSHLEGIEKPDPVLFRRALDRLDAAPGSALHVGDRPEMDLEGARRAGMDGVLVDRKGRLDPSLPVLPDLSSLPEMARG